MERVLQVPACAASRGRPLALGLRWSTEVHRLGRLHLLDERVDSEDGQIHLTADAPAHYAQLLVFRLAAAEDGQDRLLAAAAACNALLLLLLLRRP